MAVDLRVKNKLNFWLVLGTINHTICLAVLIFGYVTSGFTFHGDEFGGVMMAYALTIFIPQLFAEALIIAAIIITLLIYVFRSEIIESSKKLVLSFLSTLALVILSNFVI